MSSLWISLFIPCIALAAQSTAATDQLSIVEGTVIRAATREPVRKAHVTLEQTPGEHEALVASTDDQGKFRFADVKNGRYNLTAEKIGFLESAYGAKKPDDDGALLKVAKGEQTAGITLLLFPAGSIRGQVLDPDGDPAPNCQAVLWTQSARRGEKKVSRGQEANCDREGNFRFDGLDAGTYYVSAVDGSWESGSRKVSVDSAGKQSRIHSLATFYPAALSLKEAQSVTLEGGQEQIGVDIRIQRGALFSVRGRIASDLSSLSKYSVLARVDEGAGYTSEGSRVAPNGEFVFAGLPPGRYPLKLTEPGPNGLRTMGETEVELTDHDLTGVVITPFKPARVRVRVVIEGEEDTPLTTGSVFLHSARTSDDFASQLIAYMPSNNMFNFDSVPPGKYRIWFNNASGCYLKAIQSGTRILDSPLVDVSEGAALDLQMIFSRNVAVLGGDVELPPQDQPAPPVHVVVISEIPDEPAEQKQRWPRLDQSLHFSIENTRPGKYLAFATEDDDANLWNNEEFISLVQPDAMEVQLQEKEHRSLHLKLIRKEETEGIRKRLGI
jgi:hypothetical protein